MDVFCNLVHDTLYFTGSPFCSVSYYNYISVWPYYIVIHLFILHLEQSGFQNLFSCETALLNILNKWTKVINDDKMVGVLLPDLRKAFDLIFHDILLHKLKLYKWSDHTIRWFTFYLKGRSQCTVLIGKSSAKLTIKTGVPQGYIIGPLLFILFINDLPLAVDKSHTDMYADDS